MLALGGGGVSAQPAGCPSTLACNSSALACFTTPAGSWKYQFTCAPVALPFFTCPTGSLTASCANSAAFCSASSPACACNSSYTGAFCELPVSRCPNGLLCANGGGCEASYCACSVNWQDSNCEQPVLVAASSPSSSPSGTGAVPAWVAAPILIGLLLLFAAVAAIGFLVVRERRGRPVFMRLEPSGETRGAELQKRGVELQAI